MAPPAAVDFRFADPEPGFDRSRVAGVVARLVSVRDPSTATALEVAAGGKLYQVGVRSAPGMLETQQGIGCCSEVQ
jgi:structural maintenance of chromosome 2